MNKGKHIKAKLFLWVWTVMMLHNIIPHTHHLHNASFFHQDIVAENAKENHHHHGHSHRHHTTQHQESEPLPPTHASGDNLLVALLGEHSHYSHTHQLVAFKKAAKKQTKKQRIPGDACTTHTLFKPGVLQLHAETIPAYYHSHTSALHASYHFLRGPPSLV